MVCVGGGVPASSEGADTGERAASAAFGLEDDLGLSLDAVLLLVLEVKRELAGAAVQKEELLRRRQEVSVNPLPLLVCVCVYLLSTGVCEVDLVPQAALHLADVPFGRPHVDHDPVLGDPQFEDRRADFGCRCVRSSFTS